jgi:hypothetical protein
VLARAFTKPNPHDSEDKQNEHRSFGIFPPGHGLADRSVRCNRVQKVEAHCRAVKLNIRCRSTARRQLAQLEHASGPEITSLRRCHPPRESVRMQAVLMRQASIGQVKSRAFMRIQNEQKAQVHDSSG